MAKLAVVLVLTWGLKGFGNVPALWCLLPTLVMLFALVSAGQYFWMVWRGMGSRVALHANAAAPAARIPAAQEKEPEPAVAEEKNVAAQ